MPISWRIFHSLLWSTQSKALAVNKAEVDVFLELSCFFDDPVDVGHLISGSSAFSKTSLNIWKFMVHVLLKPGLENFEHYFTCVWDECNCVGVIQTQMHCQCNDTSKIGYKPRSINNTREDIKKGTLWYNKNLITSIYIRLILHMHLSGSYFETLLTSKPNTTPALRLTDYHIYLTIYYCINMIIGIPWWLRR